MLKRVFTILASTVALAAAQTIVDGFDDIVVGPRTIGQSLDTYRGLRFNGGFYVQNPQDTNGAVRFGFNPPSGPNGLVYFTSLVSGAPTPNIKAHYSGSTTSNFTLESFKWGCVVGKSGVPYSISRCNLAAFGYIAGRRVATQAFSFAPNARLLVADMITATLSADFQNVDTVRFATVYAPSVAALAASGFSGGTWFDDLQFTLYQKEPAGIPISTDNRCGEEFNTRCPDDLCCSVAGYCGPYGGLDPYYWCAASECQIGFGRCDPATT